jgi:hypothetical protein
LLFSDLQTHPKKPLPRETNASEIYGDPKEDSDTERQELLEPPKKPLPRETNASDDDVDEELPAPPSVNDEDADYESDLRSLPPVESDSDE